MRRKMKAILALLRSDSYLVIARRGDTSTLAVDSHYKDPIWDVALDKATDVMMARVIDMEASEALGKLKQDCGLP